MTVKRKVLSREMAPYYQPDTSIDPQVGDAGVMLPQQPQQEFDDQDDSPGGQQRTVYLGTRDAMEVNRITQSWSNAGLKFKKSARTPDMYEFPSLSDLKKARVYVQTEAKGKFSIKPDPNQSSSDITSATVHSNGGQIGDVQYYRDGNRGHIEFFGLGKEHRGQGLSAPALSAVRSTMLKDYPGITEFTAEVESKKILASMVKVFGTPSRMMDDTREFNSVDELMSELPTDSQEDEDGAVTGYKVYVAWPAGKKTRTEMSTLEGELKVGADVDFLPTGERYTIRRIDGDNVVLKGRHEGEVKQLALDTLVNGQNWVVLPTGGQGTAPDPGDGDEDIGEATDELHQKILSHLESGPSDLRSIHWAIKGAALDDFKKALSELQQQGLVKSSVETKLTGAKWLRGTRPNRRTVYALASDASSGNVDEATDIQFGNHPPEDDFNVQGDPASIGLKTNGSKKTDCDCDDDEDDDQFTDLDREPKGPQTAKDTLLDVGEDYDPSLDASAFYVYNYGTGDVMGVGYPDQQSANIELNNLKRRDRNLTRLVVRQGKLIPGTVRTAEFPMREEDDVDDSNLTPRDTNYYKGVYYMPKERAERIAERVGGEVVKHRRGFVVLVGGKPMGPTNKTEGEGTDEKVPYDDYGKWLTVVQNIWADTVSLYHGDDGAVYYETEAGEKIAVFDRKKSEGWVIFRTTEADDVPYTEQANDGTDVDTEDHWMERVKSIHGDDVEINHQSDDPNAWVAMKNGKAVGAWNAREGTGFVSVGEAGGYPGGYEYTDLEEWRAAATQAWPDAQERKGPDGSIFFTSMTKSADRSWNAPYVALWRGDQASGWVREPDGDPVGESIKDDGYYVHNDCVILAGPFKSSGEANTFKAHFGDDAKVSNGSKLPAEIIRVMGEAGPDDFDSDGGEPGRDTGEKWATFTRGLEISMTMDQARSISGPGAADDNVAALRKDPQIAAQLQALDPEDVRAELKEYGAWDDSELADDDANLNRILWIAGGQITDNPNESMREKAWDVVKHYKQGDRVTPSYGYDLVPGANGTVTKTQGKRALVKYDDEDQPEWTTHDQLSYGESAFQVRNKLTLEIEGVPTIIEPGTRLHSDEKGEIVVTGLGEDFIKYVTSDSDNDITQAIPEFAQDCDKYHWMPPGCGAVTAAPQYAGESLTESYDLATGSKPDTHWERYISQKKGTVFTTTPKVTVKPRMEAGVYTFNQNMDGSVTFERKEIRTDEILKFEDSRYNTTLDEIDQFFTPEMVESFKNAGFTHKRGVLMYGAPGTGKSVLLKQVMESSVAKDMIVLIASSASGLTEALMQVREIEPARSVIVVMEDMDEIVSWNEHAILQLMDGDDSLDGVLILGTTNYIERLPPRILRPGRFDTKVEIGNPPDSGRRAYLRAKLKSESDERIDEIVAATKNFSFAMLRELVVCMYCYKRSLQDAVEKVAGRSASSAGKSIFAGLGESVMNEMPYDNPELFIEVLGEECFSPSSLRESLGSDVLRRITLKEAAGDDNDSMEEAEFGPEGMWWVIRDRADFRGTKQKVLAGPFMDEDEANAEAQTWDDGKAVYGSLDDEGRFTAEEETDSITFSDPNTEAIDPYVQKWGSLYGAAVDADMEASIDPPDEPEKPYDGPQYSQTAVPEPGEMLCPACGGEGGSMTNNGWTDCHECHGAGVVPEREGHEYAQFMSAKNPKNVYIEFCRKQHPSISKPVALVNAVSEFGPDLDAAKLCLAYDKVKGERTERVIRENGITLRDTSEANFLDWISRRYPGSLQAATSLLNGESGEQYSSDEIRGVYSAADDLDETEARDQLQKIIVGRDDYQPLESLREGHHEVRELVLYATNDGDLYRQRIQPVMQNLAKKQKKNIYNQDLALRSWKMVADDAAVRYGKEFSTGDGKAIFTPEDRRAAAVELRDHYDQEVRELAGQGGLDGPGGGSAVGNSDTDGTGPDDGDDGSSNGDVKESAVITRKKLATLTEIRRKLTKVQFEIDDKSLPGVADIERWNKAGDAKRKSSNYGGGHAPYPDASWRTGSGRVSMSELENWVNNDESLYNWWKGEGGSLRSFVQKNRDEIEQAVNKQLGKGPAEAIEDDPSGADLDPALSSAPAYKGTNAFDVYLNGAEIDTVFYSAGDTITPEEVRRALIDHDGYDPSITVSKRRGDSKTGMTYDEPDDSAAEPVSWQDDGSDDAEVPTSNYDEAFGSFDTMSGGDADAKRYRVGDRFRDDSGKANQVTSVDDDTGEVMQSIPVDDDTSGGNEDDLEKRYGGIRPSPATGYESTGTGAASFEDWKAQVEQLLKKRYFISTDDVTDDSKLHDYFDNGESPEDFVEWVAGKYDLNPGSDYGLDEAGCPSGAEKRIINRGDKEIDWVGLDHSPSGEYGESYADAEKIPKPGAEGKKPSWKKLDRNPKGQLEAGGDLANHPHQGEDGSWWEYDAQGIPLVRVCEKCRKAKLARYRPEILSGYTQADVDEPIEPDESVESFDDVAGGHQKKIAIRTLKMNDTMANVMGGMNKDEARSFLKSIGWSDEQIRKLEGGDVGTPSPATNYENTNTQFADEKDWKSVAKELGASNFDDIEAGGQKLTTAYDKDDMPVGQWHVDSTGREYGEVYAPHSDSDFNFGEAGPDELAWRDGSKGRKELSRAEINRRREMDRDRSAPFLTRGLPNDRMSTSYRAPNRKRPTKENSVVDVLDHAMPGKVKVNGADVYIVTADEDDVLKGTEAYLSIVDTYPGLGELKPSDWKGVSALKFTMP